MDQKLKDKLSKLYQLSKRGVDGEKDNAEVMLQKLLKKHNLSIEDISEDQPKERYYKYTTKINETIISQIIAKVTNRWEIYIIKSYKEVNCKVTDYEHIQILEMIDFHLENFQKERKQILDDLVSAYVQKHRLFRNQTDEELNDREPLTTEEKQAIFRMEAIKGNLSSKTYIKKLSK